jgi:hypothetical protein
MKYDSRNTGTPGERDQVRQRIRVALALRNMNGADLATELGYDQVYIRNIICGSAKARPVRDKIEDFLGEMFWSNPADFAARQTKQPTTNEP